MKKGKNKETFEINAWICPTDVPEIWKNIYCYRGNSDMTSKKLSLANFEYYIQQKLAMLAPQATMSAKRAF